MIFDTHTHLNEPRILENLDIYLKEAKDLGINKFLCVGWDYVSSKKAVELANKYEEIYAAIAIMPTEHKFFNEKNFKLLEELLKTSNKIIAIGETGLDYYWEKDEDIKKLQKEMFIKHIQLANKYNLPVSIHCRDAIQDTFDILKEYRVKQAGVMHCYSGSVEMAKEFIKLGYKIAFGGVLTFKNSIISKQVLTTIPLESIVLETDSPYLAPMPYRGKLNEPKFIKKTAEFAANLLKMEENEFEKIIYKNSLNIFHVKTNEDDN